MLDEADDEPGERERGGVIAAMHARSMGMADRSGPVLLVETGAQKQNLMAPRGIAMRSSVVGLACKRPI